MLYNKIRGEISDNELRVGARVTKCDEQHNRVPIEALGSTEHCATKCDRVQKNVIVCNQM